MKHPHAELMLQYAQDAMTTDKPWELWEFLPFSEGNWQKCIKSPEWHISHQYRRKPNTVVKWLWADSSGDYAHVFWTEEESRENGLFRIKLEFSRTEFTG